MESRSTPKQYRDLNKVKDVRGLIWEYNKPTDIWFIRDDQGMKAVHSARSWHKLNDEFGPLENVK